ncbi:type I phosphomannose isomerase catalytic subunit [Nibricoccus sp. IMCC34717]|uniref:type I phosphomannose isomerase catalytic subunit n=1 Tax=Nibricoccus sp. IMCC34717 TaxID=3034021 RepID=UPI00384E2CBE
MLRLQPLYQERVWGGRALQSALGRSLPGSGPIGESWEIVDRPEAQSVIRGGDFDGKSLREVLASHSAAIMGPRWPAEKPFPILVKWLDCRERLSLQVHPPRAVCAELKGEPKTENWFIAETQPGSQLIVGLKRGVTRDQFERALKDNTLESCVHSFPVSAGDSILVRSGQIHAIDGGNLILEIQQNSDTTYRVYDWGRLGLNGKPRDMHVHQSLLSIKWDDFEPAPVRGEPRSAVIADADEFRITRRPLARGEVLAFASGEQPRIVSVVSGRLRAGGDVFGRGENLIVGHAESASFTAEESSLVLITDNFAR